MMEKNSVFRNETSEMPTEGGKRPLHVPALVLGIVALVMGAFSPLVAYICGIIGLVFAIRKRRTHRTVMALVLCIAGLIVGVVSNVIAAQQIIKILEQMGGS